MRGRPAAWPEPRQRCGERGSPQVVNEVVILRRRMPSGQRVATPRVVEGWHGSCRTRCSRPSSSSRRPRPDLVPRPRLRERLDRGSRRSSGRRSSAPGRLREDDPARRLAGSPAAPTAQVRGAWLSLDAADNDPARVLDLRGRRLRTVARASARRARTPEAPGRRPSSRCSTDAPQRARGARPATSSWCSTTTTSSIAPRVHEGMAFLLDHLPAAAAPGASPPGPTRRCRWRGCGPAASSSRSGPPTCASPPRRRRATSTTSWARR